MAKSVGLKVSLGVFVFIYLILLVFFGCAMQPSKLVLPDGRIAEAVKGRVESISAVPGNIDLRVGEDKHLAITLSNRTVLVNLNSVRAIEGGVLLEVVYLSEGGINLAISLKKLKELECEGK